jgi:hypothetical protein
VHVPFAAPAPPSAGPAPPPPPSAARAPAAPPPAPNPAASPPPGAISAASAPIHVAREPLPGAGGTLARAASGGGGGGGGGDTDAIYDEVLRRLRQEQEQLGQIIPHPF